MKSGKAHLVPLAPRAVEILTAARRLTHGQPTDWIFPGTRPGQPLSNMTFLKAARRLKKGGKVEKKKAEQKKADITTHGFRSSFRDWSAEKTNAPQIVCEAALAHVVKDKAEAAYRRGDLFDKRRTLMATWAAFVTSTPADIVTISA